jgi:CheY-like chemotaxis protein
MRNQLKRVVILLADDDEEDRMLACDAVAEAQLLAEVVCVTDGEELMDYLNLCGKYAPPAIVPRPSVIFLDLNMPKKDGREALREIKGDPKLRRIPVVILTTSKAEEDILRSYDSGASSFISKPVTFQGLVELMKRMGQYWFDTVHLPHEEASAI